MELFVASAEVDEWDIHDGTNHHEKDGVEVLNLIFDLEPLLIKSLNGIKRVGALIQVQCVVGI